MIAGEAACHESTRDRGLEFGVQGDPASPRGLDACGVFILLTRATTR